MDEPPDTTGEWVSSGGVRELVGFDTGWLFGGRFVDGAAEAGYDDTAFECVSIPHCVAPLSWNDWDPAAWDGRWIYRRHLRLDADERARLQAGRVRCEFDGVLTSATVLVNGQVCARRVGGYLPFAAEITELLVPGDNVIAVIVDGSWQQVPPDGHPDGPDAVDYYQPAGIYRDVRLRCYPPSFVADVFAQPVDVLTAHRRVRLAVTVESAVPLAGGATTVVELLDSEGSVVSTTRLAAAGRPAGRARLTGELTDLAGVALWQLDAPTLYTVRSRLQAGSGELVHEHTTRIGFRDGRFDRDGFHLNGQRVQLFGLNRHQLYPYVGHAMPARVQRRDAQLLKDELHVNIVRCAHYPQSRHFLDACDELGLLVWAEPPGWQYLPDDDAWRALALRDVRELVTRDRNRPSIVLWAARLNETANAPEFYARTKAAITELDPSRPTTGSMTVHSTQGWHQDVFAFDDYAGDGVNAFLHAPLDVPYLVAETVGALSARPLYRRLDKPGVLAQQAIAHAQAHDVAAAHVGNAGVIGWLAFDYASHHGNVFRTLKTPGVADTFRIPKPGAAFYRSQVDPTVRPVIEPGFVWGFGDGLPPAGPGRVAVWSNCDRLEVTVGAAAPIPATPDRQGFPRLAHPPTFVSLVADPAAVPELRIDGFVGDRLVATRRFSSDRSRDRLHLSADDEQLLADGSDATRLVVAAVDEFGNWRPHAGGAVAFEVDGPAVLVGDNPFAFADSPGAGAVWLRTRAGEPGQVRVQAAHPQLGVASVLVRVVSRGRW